MTSNALDFSSPLSSDEEDYINISLEPIKDAINSELDLFEVVQKFGIKLRKLPKNAKERENWSNHEIYTGDCPKCSEKGSFRVFRETQAFGCLNCHFDGEFPEHGNGGEIFRFLRDRDFLQDHKFLTNCGELIYSGDEGHIAELFELFPEKLAFLKGKNLNRFEYRGDYFNLADKYYPGIEADMERVNTERIKYSKIIYAPKKIGENGRECEQKLYQRFNELEKETSRLYRIIEGYKVVSEIYARREKVDGIIQMQSPADIGLESGVPDELLEIREETPEITDNTDNYRSGLGETARSENIGVHFTIPIDRDKEKHHYIEIPDATFKSSIVRPKFPDSMGNPIVGNYSIAYSKQENNFSIFLSPEHEEMKLHEMILHTRGPCWIEGSTPEFKIEHLVGSIKDGTSWGIVKSKKENQPVLSSGYHEVAMGMWIYTGIGMYFSFNGKTTTFDKNLFYKCVENISGIPVFTDKNKRAFISEFNERVWEPRCERARRTAWPVPW